MGDAIPYTFAGQSGSIPLAELDSNFTYLGKFALGSVNVMNYGSIGDGMTDDTSAIQAAINAVPTTTQEGYEVFFPPGRYKFSTLTIGNRRLSLIAQSKGTAANGVALVSTAASGNAIDASAITDTFSMSGLNLEGPGSGTANGLLLGTLNSTANAFDSHIQDCWFGGFAGGYCIYVNAAKDYSISNNGFENSAGGIYFADTASNAGLTEGNLFNRISGNIFYTLPTAIRFGAASLWSSVTGNTFLDCGSASDTNGDILIASTGNPALANLIASNVFQGSLGHSIALIGTAADITDIHIVGNLIAQPARSAILVNAATNISIVGNHIWNANQAGSTYNAINITGASNIIFVGSNTNYNTNTAPYSTPYGLIVGATVTSLTLGENQFTGNATAPMDITAGATFLVPSVPFLNATLTNSWTNTTGTAGYAQVGATVRLTGLVGGGSSGTSAFTLPAWARPATQKVLSTSSDGLFGTVTIGTDGTVTLTGSTTHFSLDGLSFTLN